MTDNNVLQEKVRFRPRARLLYIIGGDLIKDERAGVIELVKNAYDADAKRVTITFKNLNDPDNASLIIDDDGHGMSRAILEDSWLSPATGIKGRQETSPGGRPMQGRKGIGRFSAMRLGDHLVLETVPGKMAPELKAEELGKRYRLELKWAGLEESEEYLDQLEFELEIFDNADPKNHSVHLEITQLGNQWDLDRVGKLIRELRLLLSPFPLKRKQDRFEIHLDFESSGLDKDQVHRLSRKIEPYRIPEVQDYVVTAEINEFGKYKLSYERKLWANEDPEEDSKVEPGEDIRIRFRQEDRDRFPSRDAEGKRRELPCGPLSIRFHIWDRDIELLQSKAARLSSDVEEMGIRAIRRLLDDVSGISIYRDDIRVRPYGDEDKDWLGLGQRRVQLRGSRIGPNQLFGIIDISSIGNPELDDKASREGLKENEAYSALQACVLALLGWTEPFRYRFRERHNLGRPEPKSTRALVEERKRAFESLRERVPDAVKDGKARRDIVQLVDVAEKVAEREHERFAEQTRIMHDTHALGLLARFVLHEGRNLGGTLNSGLRNLERLSQKKRKQNPERIAIEGQALVSFDSNLQSARNAVGRLDTMLDQLDPLTRPRRSRRSHVVVEDIMRKVLVVLEPGMQDAGIKFSLTRQSHKAMAWEADLFHALHNLLHNSIYWVQENPRENRKVDVRVRFRARDRTDERPKVEITVSDNGPGVTAQADPCIFDLGYTEKPDGYGVGLFIAREAIERSGGSIELLNPGERGAQFQIVLEGGR